MAIFGYVLIIISILGMIGQYKREKLLDELQDKGKNHDKNYFA